MKISKVLQRSLTILILLFLCLSIGPIHSDAASTPSTVDSISITPIGPVQELPGSTLTRIINLEPSYIAKTGGLTLTISGIQRDKYTSVYWGPNDLTAIRHALQGPLTTDRIMVYYPAMSDLTAGTAYWLGSSPNIYQAGDIGTRFRLLTSAPMVLADDAGISTTDVVFPVSGNSFSANLLFETNYSAAFYAPSNNYFDSWQFKSPSLTGSILSSLHDAFWYTAPDVEILIQPAPTSSCMDSLINITIIATNQGPGPATQIQVTNLLPVELEFISYEASPCGITECYDPITGIWSVGSLTEGSESLLTLTVKVVAPGQATFSGSKTQYQVDPVVDNDTASEIFDTCYCSFLPLIER